MQARRRLELADGGAGEFHGESLGLALRQVHQDTGDIVRLGAEIDAGDDIGLVLIVGEPRRFGVGRMFR
jgi:hypothetical protein